MSSKSKFSRNAKTSPSLSSGRKSILDRLFGDIATRLSLFKETKVEELRCRVTFKNNGDDTEDVPYIKCIVRGKRIELTPEEVVRQLYADELITKYGYSSKPDKDGKRLSFEYPVTMGSDTSKFADIAIIKGNVPYIIIETKKPGKKQGKKQLFSYCNATGAAIGVLTNGNDIDYFFRYEINNFKCIADIPYSDQDLDDVIGEKYTLKTLYLRDKIANERISLRKIIQKMENDVFANSGEDVFEEIFKLIFSKLYDEYQSHCKKGNGYVIIHHINGVENKQDLNAVRKAIESVDDKDFRSLEFRKNLGETDNKVKKKIQKLFSEANNLWKGIFPESSSIKLTDSHLAVCVRHLQDIKLFNSNLMIIDEAFEYLVSKSAKSEKGQFFTPRHVIDMCVKMLDPKGGEYMIDTAAGSCGFPVHTIFHITKRLFSIGELSDEEEENILKIFGIEFDEKAVRVARTLNLIAGDGQTNVLHLNTLDFSRWDESTHNDNEWIKTYGKGFSSIENLMENKGDNRKFLFDVLMANPPFAGPIYEEDILNQFRILDGKQPKNGVVRDILFIERNLDFIKPGGRMAVVLPQGRFDNMTDKNIRDFITKQARILAVVSLHPNTFKPHAAPKTSVLFLQKWDDELCPWVPDYPIFFAVSKNSGKNNSGNYTFKRNSDGQFALDDRGHLIVQHDLHNHVGELSIGVAESFILWAKNQNISFLSDYAIPPEWYKETAPFKEFSIRQYSETIKCNRIDAEYFQNEHYALIDSLNKYSGGANTLGSLVLIKDENYQPSKEEEYRYIELANISKNCEIASYSSEVGKNLPTRARRKVSTGDVIVSYLEGSLSSIALVEQDNNESICSNGFWVINSKDINPESILLLLKSSICQSQLKRGCSGTILASINKDELKKVVLPVLTKTMQSKVKEKVTDALKLRKECNSLLDSAKQAIEIAVEKGDDAAIKWLEDKTNKNKK